MPKIYTSYFAKVKELPDNVIPIAICGKSPDWWDGKEYKKLAPKWSFFNIWKQTHDNAYYISEFNKQVLAELNQDTVIEELSEISEGNDICLICYENPTDFCHRHLVAEWLNSAGYDVTEYLFEENKETLLF